MRFASLIVVILFAVLFVTGCAAHRKQQPTTKQEQSVAGGFAQLRAGDARYHDASASMNATALTDRQKGYVEGMDGSHKEAIDGGLAAEKSCITALDQVSDQGKARQNQFNRYNMLGCFAFALGVAIAIMAPKEPPFVKLVGYGIAAFGGILSGLMIFQRGMDMALPWLAAGVCVLILASIGYMVFVRLMIWRRLHREQLATKELTKTTSIALEQVPDERKFEVMQKISAVQSPSTAAMVTKAKADIASDAATAAVANGLT